MCSIGMNKYTFKKQQKWTALLVALTFSWLLHASAMPLAAVGAPEQVAVASPEQATGFIEQEGPEWNYARKKSCKRIIIWCLIGFAVYAVIVALTRGFGF